jgi:MHS family proline/betaine transporter-like MFS transporter
MGENMRKVLISGMIGNALEWYDYALYAQFAYIIGAHFFPESNLREILTFAVFAAGFIVRPLGAVFFGNIGDKLGRRLALTLGILMMAIPTAGIGLLPSYDSIGVAAPIILTIIRLIQGFSLGGEFSGCIAYIVESSNKENRGAAGSAAFMSMCLGMLFGTFTAAFCRYTMDEKYLFEFGWRIPFILGLFIGLIGLYIRMHLHESPIYQAAKAHGSLSRTPLRDLLRSNMKELCVGMGIYLTVTVPFYIVTVFIDSYMQQLGFSPVVANQANITTLVVMTIVLPISAIISDRIGRKPIMVSGCIAFALFSYPLFWLMNNTSDANIAIFAAGMLSAISGFFMGPVPTVLVELFPTRVRFTGVALSYNMSAAVFGGTAPMVSMILINNFADKTVMSYYISIFVVLTLVTLMFYKETFRSTLHES